MANGQSCRNESARPLMSFRTLSIPGSDRGQPPRCHSPPTRSSPRGRLRSWGCSTSVRLTLLASWKALRHGLHELGVEDRG